MNRNLPAILTGILTCLHLTLAAQQDLPYYSGFDNTSERDGWQIYRTGENALANWSISTVGGFSPTSCISHDYAPSSGATVADDWYVSPGFLIPAGGRLDSVRYLFSGFSVPAQGDTIGIFLLTGSQNPTSATSITLLADFRGDLYQADATYRLLGSIPLPSTQETAYIAIRYRNAEVSSSWLTVRFDNIAVSGQTTAVHPPTSERMSSIYPNPCTDVIHIQHADEAGTIVLQDNLGRAVCRKKIIQGQSLTSLPVHYLPSGFYFIAIQQSDKAASHIFMKY